MNNLQNLLKKLDELIKFYDPNQERDASGKWSGSGGKSSNKKQDGIIPVNPPTEIPTEKIKPEIVSEIVGDKLDDFFEKNGSDIDEEYRESPIKAFVKASDGWMGSSEPSKYTEQSVKNGINRILRIVDAVGEVYGQKEGTFGGAFAKLGEFLEKLSESQNYTSSKTKK